MPSPPAIRRAPGQKHEKKFVGKELPTFSLRLNSSGKLSLSVFSFLRRNTERNYFTHHTPLPVWTVWFKKNCKRNKRLQKKKQTREPVDKILEEKIPQGKERCRGIGEPKPPYPIWAKAPKY